MSDLLPCPFCNHEAERVDIPAVDNNNPNAGGSYIHCTFCDIAGRIYFGEKDGIDEHWNRRAAPSPATPEAEGDEIQNAVNLVCNHLNEHSRELGGAGMIAEAQEYAHAAALVRRYFGDKK